LIAANEENPCNAWLLSNHIMVLGNLESGVVTGSSFWPPVFALDWEFTRLMLFRLYKFRCCLL